jgi:hypothetical protein
MFLQQARLKRQGIKLNRPFAAPPHRSARRIEIIFGLDAVVPRTRFAGKFSVHSNLNFRERRRIVAPRFHGRARLGE